MIHPNTPVLETKRLILRAPEHRDYDGFETFFLSDRAHFVGGGSDKTQRDAWRTFAVINGHWLLRGYGLFMVEDRASGNAIGSIGPWFPKDWPEQELGWSIWDAEHEGKGYASEAAERARQYVFADLGWKTAVSYIDIENPASIALAERLGCLRDDTAAKLDHVGPPVLVYRHPNPGATA